MNEHITELAFKGNWNELLPLLRRSPYLVNTASQPKGYTALHQAAWHGADLAVVGELMALGADRALKTHNKSQTAQDIVTEKHAARVDLKFVLTPGRRTLAQLMRKVVSDTPDLFGANDGNRVLCDRLIECFGADFRHLADEAVEVSVEAGLKAVAGATLSPSRATQCGPNSGIGPAADTGFWKDRFLPVLQEYASRAHLIPVEKEWAVVSDLFDPAPQSWGLRGDPFLWMEMRQALCHVPIPPQPEQLAETVSSAFAALTGMALAQTGAFYVARLARGGMSSGMVSCDFWLAEFIPLLQRRSSWLQATWSWQST